MILQQSWCRDAGPDLCIVGQIAVAAQFTLGYAGEHFHSEEAHDFLLLDFVACIIVRVLLESLGGSDYGRLQ